ncbi:hypothetical protein EXIGLDRAFT_749354 [Exidia glandulosa HHB12029]|uniref:Kinetochore protein Sos7 coiled-coil domain-containing protein n=1 Tax=Exidia glandulosa HHB12029 TaxID=1314781 RepID=A0A166AL44_EXIGL|nr:hypothetical protein EXIGLDRAFT_749354 [Exidia glandulosa HHB12029]
MDQDDAGKVLLDDARSVHTMVQDDGAFHIRAAKDKFAEKEADFRQMTDSALSVYPHNPNIVAEDVKTYYAFLKKLKFAFIQQNAKDKYMKAILGDEQPLITPEDNRELKRTNEKRKAALKEDKDNLHATFNSIAERSAAVSASYAETLANAEEARQAAQDILDAQLELSRLRAAHPAPRLTIHSATSFLDAQVDTMQALEDQRVEAQRRTVEAKDALKGAQRELERLRAERNDKEAKVAELARQQGDTRLVGLSDWYALQLAQYRAMLGIISAQAASDNEIQVEFARDGGGSVVLSLVFEPGQRRLAEARLLDSDIDIENLAAECVQSNDVLGIVTGLRQRLQHPLR